MFDEKKFNFNIENIKKDMAVENMYFTPADVNLLKKYEQNQISAVEMINSIKKDYRNV